MSEHCSGSVRCDLEDLQEALSIHSLYIAQVWDKLGIKLHESANKVAQPKRKVSICPDYKEAAILDAFQHYGII